MIPTPDLSHLTRKDYDLVYEPAEDTFILLDALEQDAEELKRLRPSLCLEVGPGSGCVSAFLASILGDSSLYLATDINPHACRCTIATARKNKSEVDTIHTSLTRPLSSRLRNSVDLLIFNPPYVPTESTESQEGQKHGQISGSWAGGFDGMEVTNTLLDESKTLLSANGRFYLVAIKQNNIPDISQKLSECGMTTETVLQRRAGREHLFVLRISRNSTDHE
ncbi:S-adenosyl-L-methionine-dependent methyltransferase [Thelephora terrestris]|uniref:S-adenosyl-L-methionine-dependent methyltransferase n=1 Tax=Thelephora terrestris TaxID=56493 RepID=A0A9P6HH13_9AGAM|nr:S-adenosyl-L-methionine-dependent methyltransferase [Thelephora terrestris]